jgi:hypothetical protein
MPNKKWIWVLITGILITIIICLLTCKKGKDAIGTTFVPHYRDTIYRDKYIHDTLLVYSYKEKPNVTSYKDEPRVDSFITFRYIHDTITRDKVLEGLKHDTIFLRVNPGFLVNYPDHPKLLRTQLDEDSLNFDLYYPTGKIYTKSYPINLTQNKYVWEDDDLKVIKKPFKLSNIRGQSNFYTLYDPLQRGLRLQVDYIFTYKNIGLYGLLSLEPNARPVLGSFIGTRVKIK